MEPPENYSQRVAAEFRAEAGRKQISISQIAAKVGLHPNTVSLKLRGDKSFTVDDFFAFASALDVSPADVVNVVESSLVTEGVTA